MSISMGRKGKISPGFILESEECSEKTLSSSTAEDIDSSDSLKTWMARKTGGSGSNSDDEGEVEVQSPYKGPLDRMDSLQDALPICKEVCNTRHEKCFPQNEMEGDSSSMGENLENQSNDTMRKRKSLKGLNNFHRLTNNFVSKKRAIHPTEKFESDRPPRS